MRAAAARKPAAAQAQMDRRDYWNDRLVITQHAELCLKDASRGLVQRPA